MLANGGTGARLGADSSSDAESNSTSLRDSRGTVNAAECDEAAELVMGNAV